MKNPMFQTAYAVDEFVPEYNSGEQITVPDQSCSMREILQRAANGIVPNGNAAQAVYNENHEYKDLKSMDLTEIDALREQFQEDFDQKKSKLEEYENKKSEIDAEIKRRKAIDDFKKSEAAKVQE